MRIIRSCFVRNVAAATIVAALSLCLPGCGRGETRSAAEIKADVVASLLKGMKRQGSQLSAETFDAQAQELRNVRVVGKKGLLYAERATIAVDEATKAVRIRLYDVVVTQPIGEEGAASEGQGAIVRYREMVLDDIQAPAGE